MEQATDDLCFFFLTVNYKSLFSFVLTACLANDLFMNMLALCIQNV